MDNLNNEISHSGKEGAASRKALEITHFILLLFSKYLFIFGRVQLGEGQRERETQNPKQAPGSAQSAQSPTRGSNSRTVRSWPEPKPDAELTEPPRRS